MTEVNNGMDQGSLEAERDAGYFFTQLQDFAFVGQFNPFHFVRITFGANNAGRKRRGAAVFTFGGG